MHPLFRNPLLQLLRRLWWLPVMLVALAWGVSARSGWRAFQLVCLLSGFVVGLIVAALGHGICCVLHEHSRHRTARHRFLCPRCLHFGDFRFACGMCGNEVTAFRVLTRGAYANECPHCLSRLFDRRTGQPEVRAYCRNCLGSCDRNIHHRQRVRVIATLLPENFDLLCQLAEAEKRQTDDRLTFICVGRDLPPQHRPQGRLTFSAPADDSDLLNYILSYDYSVGADRPDLPTHALRHIEAIWLDVAAADPLRLGRIVDGFIRQSGLSEQEREQLTIFIRQAAPDAAIINKLQALFGNVQCGCEPERLLSLIRPTLKVAADHTTTRQAQPEKTSQVPAGSPE
ncbi:MAG: hypothetical protein U0Z53_12975 [Blastocatellia bacterium]